MHKDYLGRKVFAPFKSCPGFVEGGGRLDEIDTCVCRRYVKSDIARSRQSTKLTTPVLKCEELFQLQRQRSYGSKRF